MSRRSRPAYEHVIILQKDALAQMLMSALEAYTINWNRKTAAVETYGLIWGTMSVHNVSRTGTVVQSLDSVSVDISAERKQGSIRSQIAAATLKHDIRRALFPDQRFLADFHTHPYEAGDCSAEQIRRGRLYEFSELDHASYGASFDIWESLGLQAGLVMTVLRTKSAPRTTRARYLGQSAIEFSLGNYRIWVKAYRCVMRPTTKEITMSDDVRLLIPHITGVGQTVTTFGTNKDGTHSPAFIQ